MSWIFGINKSEKGIHTADNYEKLHSSSLFKLSLPKLYIALGGIEETCFCEVQNESADKGWAVVGLGVRVTDSGSQLLNKNNWRNIFLSAQVNVDKLDGHFVALRWDKEKIEFFTDQLGLRTAYYGTCDAGICFSTRLDWVAQTTGLNEINHASLGERWLLYNQLTYESCVNGIERLGPSSHVVFRNGMLVKHENNSWLPEFGNENKNQAKTILESLVRASTDSGRMVSLGLSGGFDSRTILAILMATRGTKFCVHTFGEILDPDVCISEDISREFGLQRQHFSDSIPDTDTLISLVKSFVAQNILVEPASSVLRLRYYSQQHAQGQLLIDGGFGEIARRQFLNRIVRLGRSALHEGNVVRLFELLRSQRADIFNADYEKEMKYAAQQSLGITLDAMPLAAKIGIENFVDLFSVRTRVPNFGGPEQARSDALAMNFMPMVQPSFLRAAFKTKIKYRVNGRFYKDIIRTKAQRLTKFPLVKSGTTYPFGLPLPAAWLLTKIKNKIAKPYSDTTPDQFLLGLREFVLDIAHSSEVRNWHGYDKNKLAILIDEYYNGNKRLVKTVDWWLTFELWRRSLKNG